MIKIGITGQQGFVGSALYNTLCLKPTEYTLIQFNKQYFEDDSMMDAFVKECDVIVHLAAMNRHEDANVIYNTNKNLVEKLISSFFRTNSKPYVLFSSSTQEEKDNLYGKSKREGRELFEKWAKENGASFSGLIIPNVFGPFGKPFYNSVVATFCYQLTHSAEPSINQDSVVKLIYVGELAMYIQKLIETHIKDGRIIDLINVPHTFEIKVSELLGKLNHYKLNYFDQGIIPTLKDSNETNLFNTYRSYIDHAMYFPFKYKKNTDNRGTFVELIKLNVGGQVSFSTTVPNITRGNHYHTRKIERFSVIKGKAKIQLRKINTSEVIEFELDGENPAYVDMPIWYTHNISNIGTEELYTVFWINEFFDPNDADTYFENV